MIVIGGSNSLKLAAKVAKLKRAAYCAVEKKHFPDGEIYLRADAKLKGQEVVIVQSFIPQPQEAIVEAVWLAEHARRLGAKKVVLAAPYLGYMRQDKAFNNGEIVSAHVMAGLLSKYYDLVVAVDPHLHRIHKLSEIFRCNAKSVTANDVLAGYIKKKFGGWVVIGPDEESAQWAEDISRKAGTASFVLKKKRYSSRHVAVRFVDSVSLRGKDVVIVDDVVSSGHTIIEAAKAARKLGARKVACAAVHGVFAENADAKMKKAKVLQIACTNTIEGKYAKIDVSKLIADSI